MMKGVNQSMFMPGSFSQPQF